MSKPKIPPGELVPTPPKNEISNAEIERRLTSLENSLTDVRKSHLDNHKWFTTIIFSLVGLFIAYTANHSATQVSEAIRDMKSDMRNVSTDMQSRVDKATGEMEKNFRNLAGESLKKPLITIATRAGFLDGQVFDISRDRRFPILPLFLKNEGDKRTGSLSIRLSSACDLGLQNSGGEWQPVESNQKDLPYMYYYQGIGAPAMDIAPKETSTFTGYNMLPTLFPTATNAIIDCKLQIFYEAEKPAEASFQFKVR